MAMLRSAVQFLGGVLRALVALVLVFGALALGLIAAAGVLLRLGWMRARALRPGIRPPGRGNGEVIDVVVREVRAR